MGISKIHKWERAVTMILNVMGWDLEWTGGKYESFDAKGFTPKSLPSKIVSKIKKQNSSPKVFSFLFFISKLLNGIFFLLNTFSVAFFCA